MHHGAFSAALPNDVLQNINTRLQQAHARIKDVDWLLLTWGTAWVYEQGENKRIVSNCHKQPEKVIREPFAVINADDFYGRDGFRVLGQWLSKADGENRYCMVGYRVGNTLSESGTVARGICRTDANNYLTGVVERTDIARVDGRITFTGDDGQPTTTDDNTPVSMNMWGFTPDYFRYSEEYFKEFLRANIDNPKAEYYIPLMVNKLITEGTATVEVLDTTAKWFGVTYAADRQGVVDKIRALVDAGEYPAKLF